MNINTTANLPPRPFFEPTLKAELGHQGSGGDGRWGGFLRRRGTQGEAEQAPAPRLATDGPVGTRIDIIA